ncbi:MAG: hypothetical protein A3K66_04655 [Euryarchaeota archaeon RBG_16_67_27]|nr:MAG: hypothetical protein A3K66_04655 [Euryarchaeota archaeon RBG_16_67_27]
MGGPLSYDDVPPPRVWLAFAFLGVWLYLISQILRGYPTAVSGATGLDPYVAFQVLAATSGLGSIMVLSGLVAALWRSNLAAGLSPSGVRGLVLGAAGVGVLVLFEIATILRLLGLEEDALTSLVRAQAVGDVLGTALAFAGLAFLAVGLTHAVGLFRPAREAPPTPKPTAEKQA